jgi:hypothetical protein
MRLLFNSLISLLLITPIYANDLDFTIITSSGATADILQDGQDNDIEFDIQSMNGAVLDLDQIGNNNSIDVDVDGRTSNNSSMTINQSGNNKSYSGSFWCGHSFCNMTINQ